MKRLIIGGLLVALGLVARNAHAQEVNWQAAPSKVNVDPNVRPANQIGTPPATVRPISLTKPAAAPATGNMSSFRVVTPTVIRGVSQEEKQVPAVPRLEVQVPDQKMPRAMPKDNGFTPPPPKVVPSPVFGPLGIIQDEGEVWGGGSGLMGDCCDGASCAPRRSLRMGPGGFGDDCCPDRGRIWGSVQYLMWWQRAQPTPPLVSSSAPGVPAGQVGIIGLPTTTVLFDSVPNPGRPGARFALGTWLPHFCNLGIEANFFFLGNQSGSSVFGGNNGNPQIAKPFFDTNRGVNDREAVDIPGLARGTLTVNTYSQLWGIEANLRRRWRCGPNHWIDVLAGYRHLNLSEGIEIVEDITAVANGERFIERDSFRTRNQFNGFQLGLDSEWRLSGRCFIGVSTKVAVGNVHQIIKIDGSTTTFINPGTQPGGLFALPTNIGTHTANRLGVLPEVNLKLGVDITENLRVFVGYDFLYLSNVVRPGEQIDTRINQNFRPVNGQQAGTGVGDRLPAVLFRTSDFWAQGLNFGLAYRY